MRNWQVRKLRGLWWFIGGHFSGERLTAARQLIDQELEHLGAEKASVRIEREKRERESYEKFRAALIGELEVW